MVLRGIPSGIATDVRVRHGARLWVAVLVAAFVLGFGVRSIGVLEVAYRLAALVDRRLGGEDEGAARG